MPAKPKPLWRCPECGARFVTRNLWHSCGRYTLEALFARSEPHVLPLFRAYATLVRRCGRVTMVPQKTRVVFMDRVRFAGATPRKNHFVAHFILGRRVEHARIDRCTFYAPRYYGHEVRITTKEDLDATLLAWLREAYRFYGQQGHLRSAGLKQFSR